MGGHMADTTQAQEKISGHARQEGVDSSPGPVPARPPLDALVADPAGAPPLCDEEEFAAILAEAVADEAPRLFAVVQVYGDRVDAWIAAWGMAFEDRAEVVSVDSAVRISLSAPEGALRGFGFGSHIRTRLV
jgi:hypothetical protein